MIHLLNHVDVAIALKPELLNVLRGRLGKCDGASDPLGESKSGIGPELLHF